MHPKLSDFASMYYSITIREGLICIYRFALLLFFALGIGCSSKNCSDNQYKSESILASDQQTLLGPKVSFKESNTTQQDNNLEGEGVAKADLDQSSDPERLPKQKLKRVAKVEESKQVAVFFSGLARISSDFDRMIAALKQTFPHLTIVALKSVDKDSHRDKSSSLSAKLSIKDQAELAFKEIIGKIGSGSHVVLVGHSQGGLRGFTVAKEYSSRLKSEYGIVINQLITIGTPWKGAPVFDHIKHVERFNKKFDKIVPALDTIQKDYSAHVRGYFFKKAPELAKKHPKIYGSVAPWLIKFKSPEGVLDLAPQSNFIRSYVASGLKEVGVPITAIAGVLTDFSQLFDASPSPQALAQVNATYAELIGGDPKCEHDMLLPVATQHAEGLVKKNFKCIKIHGACHGNKVGTKVKDGLSELNNEQVIQKVVECIEDAFYEQKEEGVIAKERSALPAA